MAEFLLYSTLGNLFGGFFMIGFALASIPKQPLDNNTNTNTNTNNNTNTNTNTNTKVIASNNNNNNYINYRKVQ